MILDPLATILFVINYWLLPVHQEQLSDTTTSNAMSGCGSVPSWKFDANNHANVTMGDRSFLVHIPASYAPKTHHPVVVSFHGFKENDLHQEKISGFSGKGIKLNGKVSAN